MTFIPFMDYNKVSPNPKHCILFPCFCGSPCAFGNLFGRSVFVCAPVVEEESPLVVGETVVVPSTSTTPSRQMFFRLFSHGNSSKKKIPFLNNHSTVCFYTHRNSYKPVQVEYFSLKSPELVTRV